MGSSGTILFKNLNKKLCTRISQQTTWNTSAGDFTTNGRSKIQFTLPEFHDKSIIEHEVYLTEKESKYDMIIGRDIIKALQLKIDFKDDTIKWNNIPVPIKDADVSTLKNYAITDSDSMVEAADRMKKILDTKYEAIDIPEIIKECSHLTKSEQVKLEELLVKYETLFDGSLGQ